MYEHDGKLYRSGLRVIFVQAWWKVVQVSLESVMDECQWISSWLYNTEDKIITNHNIIFMVKTCTPITLPMGYGKTLMNNIECNILTCTFHHACTIFKNMFLILTYKRCNTFSWLLVVHMLRFSWCVLTNPHCLIEQTFFACLGMHMH